MTSNRISIMLSVMLCCSILLTGCKDGEKQKALEEAADLKAQVVATADALKDASDEVITLQEKLDKVIKERNMALDKARNAQVMVEKLRKQLSEQMQKASVLEQQDAQPSETVGK